MNKQHNWINDQVRKANDTHPSVNDAVSNRTEELLASFCQQPLAKSEQAAAAKELIYLMCFHSSDSEDNK